MWNPAFSLPSWPHFLLSYQTDCPPAYKIILSTCSFPANIAHPFLSLYAKRCFPAPFLNSCLCPSSSVLLLVFLLGPTAYSVPPLLSFPVFLDGLLAQFFLSSLAFKPADCFLPHITALWASILVHILMTVVSCGSQHLPCNLLEAYYSIDDQLAE